MRLADLGLGRRMLECRDVIDVSGSDELEPVSVGGVHADASDAERDEVGVGDGEFEPGGDLDFDEWDERQRDLLAAYR